LDTGFFEVLFPFNSRLCHCTGRRIFPASQKRQSMGFSMPSCGWPGRLGFIRFLPPPAAVWCGRSPVL